MKKYRTDTHQSKKQQNVTLKKIKRQLLNIFVFYTSFGDRDNYKLLKIQNYRRMLLDAQIISNDQQGKYYDIIYYQNKNRSGLSYQQFIEIVPKIATLAYQQTQFSQKQALMKLMKEHLLVLEDFIMKKTELGQDLNVLKQQLSSKSFQILYRVKFLLEKIYREYWSNQSMNNSQNHQKSFLKLECFLRQFELCPQIMSKSVAFLIYEMITQSQIQHVAEQKFNLMEIASSGNEFTFKKFIKFLISAALVGHKKISQENNISEAKKVVNLLERMEISNGFDKIYKKIQTSQLSKTTLLISQETLANIEGNTQFNSRVTNKVGDREFKQYLSSSKQKYSSNKKQIKRLEFQDKQQQIISKYINQLKLKFQIYCSFGDTLNTTTLKSIKISKILKEIGIVNLINQATLDLLISNLLRSSPSGKIQFAQFLKLLCLIAEKTKIELEKIIICIITHQGDHSEYSKKLQQINESAVIGNQHPDVYTLLKDIEKTLKIFFDFYSQSKPYMNFAQYSKFMYDFETFPFLVSKPKLFQIFNEASIKLNYFKEIKNVQNRKISQINQKVIDFQMFKECIGGCSQQIIQNKLSEVEKLLLLLERMNDSKGPKLVIKSLGNTRNAYGMKTDFLGEIRKKYSYFYQKQFFKTDKKKLNEQSFDNLILNN